MSTDETTRRLLHELDDLVPLVRERAAEADRRFALTDDVVEALVRHRLFRLWIPRRYGGFETSLPDALEIYQAAARIDGSFGWAVMIGAGGGLFAAFLDEAPARTIFEPANAVIAGSGAPEGQAERVPGGYRVRGRWRYASGAPYATTFTASSIVTSGGEPVRGENGEPLVRAMAFPRASVEILETWNALGMRATSSHDFRVDDVFVPEAMSFSVFADAPREPGPLYRIPFQVLSELPFVAVALGVARHALDAFAALAQRKRPLGAKGVLRDDGTARAAFADAFAAWRIARDGVRALAASAWEAATAGRELSAAELAEITATSVHVVRRLDAAVDELATLAGMTGIDDASELGRARRDLLTLRAHVAVSPRQLAHAGASLLGG
nr:hypothetical protein [Gammaproteobacteria bacterium]